MLLNNIFKFQQNERAPEFKKNQVTPETRLILQEWLASDYQLYNFFTAKLRQQIQNIGQERFDQELDNLKSMNEQLKNRCHAHTIDNQSLLGKGSPLHMAHQMVKAYNLTEKCLLYGTSEPAFYGMIKNAQRRGQLPEITEKWFG